MTKKKVAKRTTKKRADRGVVARKHGAANKTARKRPARKWSARVTKTSDALDLQPRVFKLKDPVKIARSLKRSAEKSMRKKGTPLQSAMSMLNFYVNRAGRNLPERQKRMLTKAKGELRKLFGKPDKIKKDPG